MKSFAEAVIKRNAEETIEIVLTDQFYAFILDEGEKRFETTEERRAAMIGAALAVGYFGNEIKSGMKI